ncbi:hypothetical protein NL108_011151 [Boleophthalmus pectinirostris]|uniref:tumor necrosis factor receptor superfamily member 5 n=1 Tax=Boleophthalmus pectinirostris TaxID=150288 RepID=UPI00242DD311|nr:tumor necrosis factor receptor superfamily member 5 [Boleophthalmus pectinirostris]KAJ0066324.1 hypothetical protein NL108_011151 [Boleophthalmus pectinirostris]
MSQKCSDDWYFSKDGRCCNRCNAGMYKEKDCDGKTPTKCADCKKGHFMATRNHMDQCRSCKTCNSQKKLKTLRECTAWADTVCECVSGFYCSDSGCGHCLQVTQCLEGHGVKVQASRTNDTICAPCESGFFSNVSDHISPCKPHTKCEDIGKELQTPGTLTTDAVCRNLTPCSWWLPAGLWIGLVVTSALLIAVALFLRWRKRQRRHKVSGSLTEVPVGVIPAEEVQLKLPLPSKELSGLYQEETYTPSYTCDLPAYESDEMELSCDGLDHEDISVPITPLKASVSFMDSTHLDESSRYCINNYHRTISEPQEDEWSET